MSNTTHKRFNVLKILLSSSFLIYAIIGPLSNANADFEIVLVDPGCLDSASGSLYCYQVTSQSEAVQVLPHEQDDTNSWCVKKITETFDCLYFEPTGVMRQISCTKDRKLSPYPCNQGLVMNDVFQTQDYITNLSNTGFVNYVSPTNDTPTMDLNAIEQSNMQNMIIDSYSNPVE